jgi:hypothetical protein
MNYYGNINEKTLELNIMSEILNICRRHDPRAFILGTTLQQEKRLGYDSRILSRLSPSWKTAMFQFKKAKYKTYDGGYTFIINNNRYNDQHLILYSVAGGRKRVAFYVLPTFLTLNEFGTASPNHLRYTFFADVSDISPYRINHQQHTITIYPTSRIGVVRSEEETRIKLITIEQLEIAVKEKEIAIPIKELLENIGSMKIQELGIKCKKPRILFLILPTFQYKTLPRLNKK